MNELAPGLWHWMVPHPHIRSDVSSYYLARERVLIDPMIPPEGLGWFEQHGAPEHVLMSNRHHDRDAWKLREAFSCQVHCIRNGLTELKGRGPVVPFDFGDELPGGVVAHEIGGICPDETALHIPAHQALACADGVTSWGKGGALTFVPDRLMDDPESTKQALRQAYRGLLDSDLKFDLLLLAHGNPVVSGGRETLEAFIAEG